MATVANKLKVGTFLIAGFLIFNGALIWIGAARLFERNAPYVTYFADSVQGLAVGSAVKYRGVALGRVTGIEVAPDGALIEVRLELARDFKVSPGLRAMLVTPGITGTAFVDLGPLPEGVAPSAPSLSFAPSAAYIPSQRSFMTNILNALTDIAAQLRATDLPGLVADYRNLANTVNRRVAGPEVDRALKSISDAAAALDGVTRGVNAFLADPRLTTALEDVRVSAGALRALVEKLNAEAAALDVDKRLDSVELQFAGALGGVDEAAARWERAATGTQQSLQDALGRIGKAVGRIESLVRSLEASPSRFLLEKPAKEDFR